MKVTKEKLENSQVLLKVEAEPQETEVYLNKAYRKMVNQVLVPGFRKGKAPRYVLERHIGKEALLKEALEIEVPELFKKALAEQQVEAVAEPDVQITKTEPVSFEAHVQVKPTVELGDYKSIRIAREPVELKDADVDNYLSGLREQNALWEPVQRAVQRGDKVTVDLQGVIDGKKAFDEKGLQLNLVEGTEPIMPGFAERLVGMAVGEEKGFELSFGENYKSRELVGKTCRIKVKVNDVKEKRLSEPNDEFAKSLNWGVDTLEALRNKIRDSLKQAREVWQRRKHEGQVLDAIVAASKVEYPPVLEEREIERLISDRVRVSGLEDLESYLANAKKSQDELKDEVREEARKRMLGTVVLRKISETEAIEVAEAEIDKEIENIVKVSGASSPGLAESLKSPAGRESVKNNLIQRKTLQFLAETALSAEDGGQGGSPGEAPESGSSEKAV